MLETHRILKYHLLPIIKTARKISLIGDEYEGFGSD